MSDDIDMMGNDKLKEQQLINDLQLKINKHKKKVSDKETRQKILLGVFLIDALENNKVAGLNDYTAKNLPIYLTRETDKKLLKGLVESLGGEMILEEDSKVVENKDSEVIEHSEVETYQDNSEH